MCDHERMIVVLLMGMLCLVTKVIFMLLFLKKAIALFMGFKSIALICHIRKLMTVLVVLSIYVLREGSLVFTQLKKVFLVV